MTGVVFQEALYTLGLADDVTRYDALGDFIPIAVGIEINASFELLQYLRLTRSGKLGDIFHVHVGAAVHTGSQRFMQVVVMLRNIGVEGYRIVENIGLVCNAVGVLFQIEDFRAAGVHFDEVEVLRGIQIPEALFEVVVKVVQHLAQRRMRFERGRFDIVQMMVGIAQLDIDRCLYPLFFGQVEWMEHGMTAFKIFEIADAVLLVYGPRSLAVVLRFRPGERAGTKRIVLFTLFIADGVLLSSRSVPCRRFLRLLFNRLFGRGSRLLYGRGLYGVLLYPPSYGCRTFHSLPGGWSHALPFDTLP